MIELSEEALAHAHDLAGAICSFALSFPEGDGVRVVALQLAVHKMIRVSILGPATRSGQLELLRKLAGQAYEAERHANDPERDPGS